MKDELRNAISSFFILNSSFLGLALLALATLAVGPQPAQAAVTEAWVHRYNNVVSNANDRASKVATDAAGDIIVTGTTDNGITGRDILTIKYSGADGSVLWQQRYNGPENRDDVVTAMAVDRTGNVIVTGYSFNAIAFDENGNDLSDTDYCTAKYAAADGALLWQKIYNGPENGYDLANAVAVDSSDNVVVTGYPATLKYAAVDGMLLWEKLYPNDTYPQAVAVDGSGDVVVTGSSSNGHDHDYYTAKYAAADGALLWAKHYNGPGHDYDVAKAIALDGSGNVVVTGTSIGRQSWDCYTAKYAAADGALLWEKRRAAGDGSAVAVDGSGNVVVTGSSGYYTAKYAAADGNLLWEKSGAAGLGGAVAVDGSGNVVVMGSSGTAKYAAADGALLWEKRYDGPASSYDYASAVVVDGSGNVIVTGTSYNGGGTGDYYTAKYASAGGALLWKERYNGPGNSYDRAASVAVDGSGNVVVTGGSYNAFDGNGNASDGDYYTAKYAVADGALLWEKRYDGPANSFAVAPAVAVDDGGNVVMTGYDDYTAKYAAADGALLWEKRYNGPGIRYSAMALDGGGNVVMTGSSTGTNGFSDYHTAKYAALDGALLWQKIYNGPENGYDLANAVAVDSSDNVVVTGISSGRDSSDYYTAKYAAADGALLWEKRYNSPGNLHSAMALDGGGNVVVTGSSTGTNGFNDYHTAKYAALDGALLWQKIYNGPGDGFDVANAVAVDSSDNVVVTGISSGRDSLDYYTAKYAAADGTLLWEKRGPNGGGKAVVVDGSGNVVVTGDSQNGSEVTDYYTAKYAAADGALLWEKRYNGPGHGKDTVGGSHSLALGPNGMVVVTGSSDGNFGSSISYDYATVVYREMLPPIAIERVPAGVRLRFTGIPGRTYNIERAPAVTGPWSTINTQTASVSSLIDYFDTNPPVRAAFYRTREP